MAHCLLVCTIDVHQLAAIVRNRIENVLVLDSRSFLEYNASHVVNAVNVGCAKLMKRRLQQEKLCIQDFLAQNCHCELDRSIDIIVYDQSTRDARNLSPDTFMSVFLQKLLPVYNSVNILKGGFLEFQGAYPHLCEDERAKLGPLTSLSQPCLPVSNHGPTRILPFLYLGSQNDALNREVMQHHNISYHLNVSTSCPKPDFIQDSHFMRIPVIDNYSEKLLPHFPRAYQFLEKVKESNGCVLVHCLAGISRSATVAISYVMKSLKMTSDEAYRYVKAKRATISPNFNFLGQLLEYEKQLQREFVLGLKNEPSSAPLFNTSSLSYEKRCRSESNDYSQKLTPDSYCVKYADVAETKTSTTHFETTKTSECFVSCERITLESGPVRIPEKHQAALSIKCLPVSSLRELSFTPCQTSSFKSTSPRADKESFSATHPEGATSPKKTDSGVFAETRSPDADSKFDFKSFNRSDSASTSGLGSEGSDCADSWNEFTSSCERETDILMDDDYPLVPSTEDDHLRRSKMISFEDSYGESLYPKYEPCGMHVSRNYMQTVGNAKKHIWKYQDPPKPASPTQIDNGQSHILYRAQSCPGILTTDNNITTTVKLTTDNNTTTTVKLRRTKISQQNGRGNPKNRFSCSSIDYADFNNVSMGRDGAPRDASGRSEATRKYCGYRHSMIQVS